MAAAGCFNPRPSLLTDERPGSITRRIMARMFQSTSVIADGRKGDEVEAVGAGDDVSIHVRHC